MSYIAIFFGRLLAFCYTAGMENYVYALVLFTVILKLLLFPISLWTQMNSIRIMKLQPELYELQIKYFGDKDRISDETAVLYKRGKYNPFAGIVPLLIQIIFLIGVMEVVRDPAFTGLDAVDMTVKGILFYAFPYRAGGLYWLMPLLAGASAMLLSLAQNRLNPLQAEQPKMSQLGTMGFSVGISLILGAFVPVGVGFYWICSNLLTILQQILLNKVMDPWKNINRESLEESRRHLQELRNIGKKKGAFSKNVYAKREKEDYKRFFSVANKHVVFYSEASGFYKYFQNVIDYLLKHSNIIIHYITSDPDDQIFKISEKENRIRPYYIGERKLITLMMKMDADIVIMTMPDIDNFHIKRSYVKEDTEYIYMFHWCTSTHLVIREKALDHYDTVFCPGPYQTEEIRHTEKMYGLQPKNLLETGYGVIENLAAAYEKMEKKKNAEPQILIAPSYQEGNIMDSCIDGLLGQLLQKNYRIIVRPHPQYIRRTPQKIEAFSQKYKKEQEEGLLELQTDFSSGDTVYQSDVVVTDWSTIAFEFSFTTMRPTLFINTPMKIMNPRYRDYPMEPLDLTLRTTIGQALELGELSKTEKVVSEMLEQGEKYQMQIMEARKRLMPNFGKSGETGGKYIIQRLLDKQKQ